MLKKKAAPKAKSQPKPKPEPIVAPELLAPSGAIPAKPTRKDVKLYQVSGEGRRTHLRWMDARNVQFWQGNGYTVEEVADNGA